MQTRIFSSNISNCNENDARAIAEKIVEQIDKKMSTNANRKIFSNENEKNTSI